MLPSHDAWFVFWTPPDEHLVHLVQRFGDRSAAQELLCRYDGWVRELVAHFAREHQYGEHEREDAAAEAVVRAIPQAIDGYDLALTDPVGGYTFRAFLWVVVRCRFLDGFRRRRRWKKLCPAACHPDRTDEALTDQDRAGPAAADFFGHDSAPLAAAARRELLSRLSKVLATLAPFERDLWDRRLSGQSLRGIASDLDESLAYVRHHWDEVKTRLRRLLASCVEG